MVRHADALHKTPVHIETNGFLLRSLTPEDVTPRFLEWLTDGEMLAGLNLSGLHFSEAQLKAFIGGFDNCKNYMIGIFDDDLLVGFYTMDVNLTHKVGNITTGVGEKTYRGAAGIESKSYRGKGVLWATIDALLDHFFLYRDVGKISARILASNKRMLFNFMGTDHFIFEARLKDECLSAGGGRTDILIFSSFKKPGKRYSKTSGA